MDNEKLSKSILEDEKRVKEDGFRAFMERPESKLLVSLIPPAETPELVQSVLKSAYEAGVNGGIGVVLLGLMKHMLSDWERGE